eukprot:TRINITY_DN1502_c0_g1_i1.p1 TRINITY_DN1502_c0_g1~~TRINITY_DN1502_c0_g1_i1.p1  ORF type:complete len:193 (-),score=42.55 TRINITY_DN1502_c0_g1_i1:203-781(-)
MNLSSGINAEYGDVFAFHPPVCTVFVVIIMNTSHVITAEEKVDSILITSDRIDVSEAVKCVQHDGAGAISTFIGTTRDNFQGKKVIKLEYEAYTPMALSEMKKICVRMREKWSLVKIALWHRIGEVGVGETSVIVAVSSVHRKEGLEAVSYGIDEIKAWAPIWKKEYYEDGSMWKDNCESCHHHQHKEKPHT